MENNNEIKEVVAEDNKSWFDKGKDLACKAWNSKPMKIGRKVLIFTGGIVAGITVAKVAGNKTEEDFEETEIEATEE